MFFASTKAVTLYCLSGLLGSGNANTVKSSKYLALISVGLPALQSEFLCAFAKLRKASISAMSVRPSAWSNSVSIGRIFVKFDF